MHRPSSRMMMVCHASCILLLLIDIFRQVGLTRLVVLLVSFNSSGAVSSPEYICLAWQQTSLMPTPWTLMILSPLVRLSTAVQVRVGPHLLSSASLRPKLFVIPTFPRALRHLLVRILWLTRTRIWIYLCLGTKPDRPEAFH